MKARRTHRPHPPHRMLGRHKRPSESTEAFRARYAVEIREHERMVRRRALGLDAPAVDSGAPRSGE